MDMTASERRPTLGGKESRSCELQVSNGQPSFKSDEHHVEEWSAQRAQRSALMPARTSWLSQRFALVSPALRQRFALAPLFGSVHALCHTPPALRAGSAELLAAISASRCMLRSTVPAHGSSQSALRSRAPRGCCHGDRLRVLSLCNRSWNFGSMSLEWAGLENADFLATDSGSFVSFVVLRIVGQSVARAPLGD